jgi:protein disulfide-isomerase A1
MKAALLVLAIILGAFATEVEEGVYVLGEDNFDSFVKENEHVLVEFYAPWCGHCKSLAPEYASAAQSLASAGKAVKLAKVDATVHSALGNKFGVQGYPTLKFFRSGAPIDYDGGRKSAEILAWVEKKSGPVSAELNSKEAVTTFAGREGANVVAYVKSGSAHYDTWIEVAKDPKFADFVGAHVVDESLWDGHKEGDLVLHKKGEESVTYSGEFEAASILKWLMAEGYPLVEELAQGIWMRTQQNQHPLLAVFHTEADSSAQDLLREVAKDFKGKALFSWSTRLNLLEQWGASGKQVPSAIMIVWKNAEPKFKIWNEDNGVAFDVAGLKDFVEKVLEGTYEGFKKSEAVPTENDGPVKTLVGKNFEEIVYNTEGKPVFVEFYAPWCGHCKKLQPVWDELGTKLATELPNVVVAKIDATANSIPDEISVSGFPTLILFEGKKQTTFNGGRDVDSFVDFLKTNIGKADAKEQDEHIDL